MTKETKTLAEKTDIEKVESKFTKEQILNSQRYQNRRDILNVILQDKKTYSHIDITKKIDEFMKGKVK